jgi:hypothetical protein
MATMIGLHDDVIQLMSHNGRFLTVVEREYSLAFGSSLAGEDLPYGLPTSYIPTNILGNFTSCT